jgi:hypothetical protein
MARGLERRLVRAEIAAPAISWVDLYAAHRRRSLRACVEWCQLIRERLRASGIDPQLAVTLRRGDASAAELEAIPDTLELKAADEGISRANRSNGNSEARQFWKKIALIAEQYRLGHHLLNLANASPAELLAFCIYAEIEHADEVSGSADYEQNSSVTNTHRPG